MAGEEIKQLEQQIDKNRNQILEEKEILDFIKNEENLKALGNTLNNIRMQAPHLSQKILTWIEGSTLLNSSFQHQIGEKIQKNQALTEKELQLLYLQAQIDPNCFHKPLLWKKSTLAVVWATSFDRYWGEIFIQYLRIKYRNPSYGVKKIAPFLKDQKSWTEKRKEKEVKLPSLNFREGFSNIALNKLEQRAKENFYQEITKEKRGAQLRHREKGKYKEDFITYDLLLFAFNKYAELVNKKQENLIKASGYPNAEEFSKQLKLIQDFNQFLGQKTKEKFPNLDQVLASFSAFQKEQQALEKKYFKSDAERQTAEKTFKNALKYQESLNKKYNIQNIQNALTNEPKTPQEAQQFFEHLNTLQAYQAEFEGFQQRTKNAGGKYRSYLQAQQSLIQKYGQDKLKADSTTIQNYMHMLSWYKKAYSDINFTAYAKYTELSSKKGLNQEIASMQSLKDILLNPLNNNFPIYLDGVKNAALEKQAKQAARDQRRKETKENFPISYTLLNAGASLWNGLIGSTVEVGSSLGLMLMKIWKSDDEWQASAEYKKKFDDFFKIHLSTEQKTSIYDFETGEFNLNWDNGISQVASWISQMLTLIYGGGALAKGMTMGTGKAGLQLSGKIASKAGLFSMAFTQQVGRSFEEGMQAGMDGKEALAYSFLSSGVQGGLELISPNEVLLGRGSGIAKGFIKELCKKGSKQSLKQVGKLFTQTIGKEIFEENIQEAVQLVAGNLINEWANEQWGSNLPSDWNWKNFAATAVITSLTTGITTWGTTMLSMPSMLNNQDKESLKTHILNDPELHREVMQVLEQAIGEKIKLNLPKEELVKLRDELKMTPELLNKNEKTKEFDNKAGKYSQKETKKIWNNKQLLTTELAKTNPTKYEKILIEQLSWYPIYKNILKVMKKNWTKIIVNPNLKTRGLYSENNSIEINPTRENRNDGSLWWDWWYELLSWDELTVAVVGHEMHHFLFAKSLQKDRQTSARNIINNNISNWGTYEFVMAEIRDMLWEWKSFVYHTNTEAGKKVYRSHRTKDSEWRETLNKEVNDYLVAEENVVELSRLYSQGLLDNYLQYLVDTEESILDQKWLQKITIKEKNEISAFIEVVVKQAESEINKEISEKENIRENIWENNKRVDEYFEWKTSKFWISEAQARQNSQWMDQILSTLSEHNQAEQLQNLNAEISKQYQEATGKVLNLSNEQLLSILDAHQQDGKLGELTLWELKKKVELLSQTITDPELRRFLLEAGFCGKISDFVKEKIFSKPELSTLADKIFSENNGPHISINPKIMRTLTSKNKIDLLLLICKERSIASIDYIYKLNHSEFLEFMKGFMDNYDPSNFIETTFFQTTLLPTFFSLKWDNLWYIKDILQNKLLSLSSIAYLWSKIQNTIILEEILQRIKITLNWLDHKYQVNYENILKISKHLNWKEKLYLPFSLQLTQEELHQYLLDIFWGRYDDSFINKTIEAYLKTPDLLYLQLNKINTNDEFKKLINPKFDLERHINNLKSQFPYHKRNIEELSKSYKSENLINKNTLWILLQRDIIKQHILSWEKWLFDKASQLIKGNKYLEKFNLGQSLTEKELHSLRNFLTDIHDLFMSIKLQGNFNPLCARGKEFENINSFLSQLNNKMDTLEKIHNLENPFKWDSTSWLLWRLYYIILQDKNYVSPLLDPENFLSFLSKKYSQIGIWWYEKIKTSGHSLWTWDLLQGFPLKYLEQYLSFGSLGTEALGRLYDMTSYHVDFVKVNKNYSWIEEWLKNKTDCALHWINQQTKKVEWIIAVYPNLWNEQRAGNAADNEHYIVRSGVDSWKIKSFIISDDIIANTAVFESILDHIVKKWWYIPVCNGKWEILRTPEDFEKRKSKVT